MSISINPPSRKPWLWRKRFPFSAWVTILSATLYFVAFGLGVVPSALEYHPSRSVSAQTTNGVALSSLPETESMPTNERTSKVTIPAVGVDTQVLNPASSDPSVLNSYLAEGAVRYPAGGHPGNGNLFIFGHSTGRDTIWNNAYKTFNGIENLDAGNSIHIHTQSGVYTYTVSDVSFKKNSEAFVPLNMDSDTLTLSTCDSFGSREDRIVVRADFSRFTSHKNQSQSSY